MSTKKVWCPLHNTPCIHASADGLENCRQCEKFNIFDYIRWLENNKKEKENKNEI